MTSLILLSIVLFASTHIDDLLLLLSFFSDYSVPRSAIVAGQYVGVTVLLLVGLLCSEISLILPPIGLRLLGLIPIAIGLSKASVFFHAPDVNPSDAAPQKTHGRHMWSVATLTMSSGGDNMGVYLPFFATHPPGARLVIVTVFLVMTAAWCLFARWLSHHTLLQPAIQRFGARALPIILIALGIRILYAG